MGLKETWENFKNWAKEKTDELKRKHMIENMEPRVLKEMIADLEEDVEFALSIEDEAERKDAIKGASARLVEVESIVDDVLKNVEKHMGESLEGAKNWLSGEAHMRDYSGLSRGKALLMNMKDELGDMKDELSGKKTQETIGNDTEESEPVNG